MDFSRERSPQDHNMWRIIVKNIPKECELGKIANAVRNKFKCNVAVGKEKLGVYEENLEEIKNFIENFVGNSLQKNMITTNFTQIKDLDKLILSYFKDEDLKSMILVNKYFYKLCDDRFFKNKLSKFFIFKKEEKLTWKSYYFKSIYYIEKIGRNFNFKFESGSPEDYYIFLDRRSLNEVCFLGYLDLVKYFLEYDFWLNKDHSEALFFATKGKQKEVILYLISVGAHDWNGGMKAAAEIGDLPLIEFFIGKGANDWNCGMVAAARGDDVDISKTIVEFFINKGADDWNTAMINSSNPPLIKYFIDKGANDWNGGMKAAAIKGNRELVSFFMDKGADNYFDSWKIAEKYGHYCLSDFIKFNLP